MKPYARFVLVVALLAACCATAALAGGAPEVDGSYSEPAHFVVTTDVVNPDIPAFTATIGAFGNSLLRGSGAFEPTNYRNSYDVIEESTDRVIVGPRLAWYDTLREGFLDGGHVRVYRIENGKVRIVRDEEIPEGGFCVSGWVGEGGSKIVPAGTERFEYTWAGWMRPDVPYYFAVVAVDKDGNESAKSNVVSVQRPENTKAKANNNLQNFREPRKKSDNTPPAAPKTVRGRMEGNKFVITWEAVRADDLAGYRVLRSDYAPEDQKGYYIQVSEGEKILPGDRVIVSKKFYSYSRKRYTSNRVYDARQANRVVMPPLVSFYPDEDAHKTWVLAKHDADTPVEDPGETCFRMVLGQGVNEAISEYVHSGTGQDWYAVLDTKPYKMEVWIKADGAQPDSVKFVVQGFDAIEPVTFTPTDRWQKFETTFTPPQIMKGNRPWQIRLEFTGPGTFSVDNYRIYRADAEYLDYLPSTYEDLAEARMMSLRTHGPIKTGVNTYSMAQFTNPGGVLSGVRKGNTLPQQLAMMRKAGVAPWLQIEMHMTPQEWREFVEYMAAPAGAGPYADKRVAQGQQKPWTDEFDKIYFEISNETWNWLFRPWIFESMTDAATGQQYRRGEVYGLFQEHVRECLRSSPHWSDALDEKFVFVLGGWSGQSYGREAASASPHSAHLTVAAYNGGWDEGEGPPQVNDPSFFNVLAQVNQTAIPRAQRHLRELLELRQGRETPLELGVYEAGPGYAMNGLNNARVTKEQAHQQELVMKSMAAGTATLDSFMARAYHGFRIQNFFTFGQGDRWSSHAKWYRGGQAYPCWMALALVNRVALGDVLRTETKGVPTVGLPKYRRRQAVPDAPLAAVYATRKDDRFALILVSRKIAGYPVKGDDGYVPVTVDLPFSSCKAMTLYRMDGDPRAENYTGPNVSIKEMKIPVSQFEKSFVVDDARGAHPKGLPPAATYVYVFEGVDTPAGKRVPIETVLPAQQ
jgi:hypothetical protein